MFDATGFLIQWLRFLIRCTKKKCGSERNSNSPNQGLSSSHGRKQPTWSNDFIANIIIDRCLVCYVGKERTLYSPAYLQTLYIAKGPRTTLNSGSPLSIFSVLGAIDLFTWLTGCQEFTQVFEHARQAFCQLSVHPQPRDRKVKFPFHPRIILCPVKLGEIIKLDLKAQE